MKNLLTLTALLVGLSSYAQTTKSNFLNISKIGIAVNDLEKSSEFYQSVFQLQPSEVTEIALSPFESSFGLSYPNGKSQTIVGSNSALELMQFGRTTESKKTKMEIPGPGLTHVCFQTPFDNSLYHKAIKKGAEVVSFGDKPVARKNGINYTYQRDLNGIVFELEELSKPPFTQDIWMGHIGMASPDIDAQIEFYTKLTGMKPVARKNDIDDRSLDAVTGIHNMKLHGAWFRIGQMGLEIWQFVTPKGPEVEQTLAFDEIGYNKITFEIKDFDQEILNIQNRGLDPQVDSKSQRALIRDNDGNLIELLGVDSK